MRETKTPETDASVFVCACGRCVHEAVAERLERSRNELAQALSDVLDTAAFEVAPSNTVLDRARAALAAASAPPPE